MPMHVNMTESHLQLAKAADDYLKIATELDPGEQASSSANVLLHLGIQVQSLVCFGAHICDFDRDADNPCETFS
jgi:hypothetical protein